MIFWWGAHSETREVGPSEFLHCGACDKDSWFARMVGYRVRHAYWLFRWVTGRQLFKVCGNCGASYLEEGDVDAPAVRKAIPAFDRRGWLAAPALIGSVGVLGSLAAAADGRANERYLAAPHVGDVYKADVARLSAHPEAPQMFTAMRVAGVKGGQVELEVANTYYTDRRGVDRDVTGGALARPGYFAPAHMVLPQAALAKLYKDGVAYDVSR